ncbi:MAG: DUF1255 family protein [Proteobacteria bacterium]|nr:DUF1255 family protein [Pseudomonadota bacterium]
MVFFCGDRVALHSLFPVPCVEISGVTTIESQFRGCQDVYFGGNVTSRTVIFEDGSKKTLGVALPGEYTFNTEEKEFNLGVVPPPFFYWDVSLLNTIQFALISEYIKKHGKIMADAPG